MEPVVTAHGLDLILVQFGTERGRAILRLYLDRPSPDGEGRRGPGGAAGSGVTVEDCVRVSREVGALLDVEDVVPGPYELEVSSPGLDRPLVRLDDFRRAVGSCVRLRTGERLDGRRNFRGRLLAVEDDTLVVEDESGRKWRVPHGRLVKANIEYEFESGA